MLAEEKRDMSGADHTSAATTTNVTTSIPQGRAGGAPARVYMNERIVPYLLEGMKAVAKDQPSNPLRVLGEFLIQKSNEVEEGPGEQFPA